MPDPKPGRPTIFSAEIAAAICERLANGESLLAICRDLAMPNRSTVYRWLAADKEFCDKYARAREAQADYLAEQALEIADTPQIGIKTKTGPNGMETTEGDMIEHRRLQVDTRKWFAAKVAPKKYGDKITTEHSGPDGGPIEHKDVSDLEAARRVAFLLERAARSAPKDEGEA